MSARKYRQRGYQDDEYESRGRSARRSKPQREGPRGRGLGAPTDTVFKCARCGARLPVAAIEPESTCGSCQADLHACVNCRHFDTTAPNECRESVEVRISAKSRRNECGLFAPKLVQEFGSDSGAKDDPKAAFDALFDL